MKQEGINLQNTQITHGAQCQKKNTKNNLIKNSGRYKQTFLQRKYTDGQHIHENMLNTAHY